MEPPYRPFASADCLRENNVREHARVLSLHGRLGVQETTMRHIVPRPHATLLPIILQRRIEEVGVHFRRLRRGVPSPVLLRNLVHRPHALDALRVAELRQHLVRDRGPAVQAVPVHVALRDRGLRRQLVGMPRGHHNLRVSTTVHGALVDVGRTYQRHLVVHDHEFAVDVDLVPSGLRERLLVRGNGHGRGFGAVLGLPVAEAVEVEVVRYLHAMLGRVGAPLVDRLLDDAVHHFDRGPLPVQYLLVGIAIRKSLAPHGKQDVHREPFPASNLLAYF
mmetsp:Transcript_37499/g.90452  ORF Transcript_37499/g.90452 Transcript_37499/m.90452 type:complete len:277 (-) Transcript_37499:1928-2758(-)